MFYNKIRKIILLLIKKHKIKNPFWANNQNKPLKDNNIK